MFKGICVEGGVIRWFYAWLLLFRVRGNHWVGFVLCAIFIKRPMNYRRKNDISLHCADVSALPAENLGVNRCMQVCR